MALSADAPVQAKGDDVVALVEKKYADVQAIKAKFVQTIRSDVFGEEVQSGELLLKRPAKMRWLFTSDGTQFVTNGKTMWVYTKVDNQVLRYDNLKVGGSTVDSLLQSLDSLRSLFEVTVVETSEKSHVLDLKPKQEDGQFKKLRLVLHGDLLLKEVQITDAVDTVTQLQLSNVELNIEVLDTAFEFEVPKGAEVIQAGQY